MNCTFLNLIAIKAEVTRLQQYLFLVTHLAFSRVFAHRVGAAPLNRFEASQSVSLKWFSSFCSWLNLYYSRWKIVKSVFEFSNAESRCWHQASLLLPLPVLVSKLQSQVNFLILDFPSGLVPFKSVYDRAVGRCYELHCDKALCKPSLSVWLSVWLSLVSCCLCFPLFCFVSPQAIHRVAFPSPASVWIWGENALVVCPPGSRTVRLQDALSSWSYVCLSCCSDHGTGDKYFLADNLGNEWETLISQKHGSHEACGKSPLVATVLSKY